MFNVQPRPAPGTHVHCTRPPPILGTFASQQSPRDVDVGFAGTIFREPLGHPDKSQNNRWNHVTGGTSLPLIRF